jgi:hypothetical protein
VLKSQALNNSAFKSLLRYPFDFSMKNFTPLVRIAIVAVVIVAVISLLVRNKADADSLSSRIKGYESRADSLRMVVQAIDENINHKDSILLVYLASLDKTLEELNKESAKNKKSIEANFARQDSVRKAYCREMANLEQHPEECQ